MGSIEKLKQTFIDRGFSVEDNVYKKVIANHNIIINGQPQMSMFEMRYVGDGEIYNDDDSDFEQLHVFDIIENEQVATTICISNYLDFVKLVNLR